MQVKKVGIGLGVALAVVFAFTATFLVSPPAQAACDIALPTDKGHATASVTIEQAGQYTVWLRMLTPAADRDSVVIQVDGQCPVIVGDDVSQPDFRWVGYEGNDMARPIRYQLEPGKHTVTLAGREAGAGVDKVLLTSDPTCVPVEFGENCLANTPTSTTTTDTSSDETKQEAASAAVGRTIKWWVVGICLAAVLITTAFLFWRYLRFTKKTAMPHSLAPGVVVGGALPTEAKLRAKLLHFWHHDKLAIFLCLALILAAIIAGVTLAADGKPEFEAEAAALSGGAKIADSQKASGGKYVVFEVNPPGTTAGGGSSAGGTTQNGGGSSTGGTSGGQNGGSTGGGETGGGGDTGTPAGQCPAFPAFPDDNCTGWQHTGVSLQTCTEGDGDEGDGHLEVPNATYDGCDFTNGAVVHSANVTIKRSRVQGVVSAHWSTDYDFQNLTMIDVEIIAATPSEIAAKNMVNNGGGSAINGANVTCIRCRIHYVPTGISLGNGSTIKDSYISDVTWGPGAHQAAIGAGGNSGHNSAIIHNRLDCSRWNVNAPGFQQGCSSALSLYDEPTLDNVLVQNNLFDTAGGYCTYGGGPQGTNIRYLDNRFGKKYHATCGGYGAVSAFYSANAGNAWNGNSWLDGSGALSP